MSEIENKLAEIRKAIEELSDEDILAIANSISEETAKQFSRIEKLVLRETDNDLQAYYERRKD